VPEEVLLDENAEAAKHRFYSLGGLAVSGDHATAAYAEDTDGSEKYTIFVKVGGAWGEVGVKWRALSV